MKRIITTITLMYCVSSVTSDCSSKEDVKRLENTVKELAEKMASLNVLKYAFQINQIDNNLRSMSSNIAEVKQNSQNCKCEQVEQRSAQPVDSPNFLETLAQKLDSYGQKILNSQFALTSKMLEIKNLVQSGFTKMLTSMTSLNGFSQKLTEVESSIKMNDRENAAFIKTKQEEILKKSELFAKELGTLKAELKEHSVNVAMKLEDESLLVTTNYEETIKLFEELSNKTECSSKISSSAQKKEIPTSSGTMKTIYRIMVSISDLMDDRIGKAHAKMIAWRHNMARFCTKSNFKSFRLCADADVFINEIAGLKNRIISKYLERMKHHFGIEDLNIPTTSTPSSNGYDELKKAFEAYITITKQHKTGASKK